MIPTKSITLAARQITRPNGRPHALSGRFAGSQPHVLNRYIRPFTISSSALAKHNRPNPSQEPRWEIERTALQYVEQRIRELKKEQAAIGARLWVSRDDKQLAFDWDRLQAKIEVVQCERDIALNPPRPEHTEEEQRRNGLKNIELQKDIMRKKWAYVALVCLAPLGRVGLLRRIFVGTGPLAYTLFMGMPIVLLGKLDGRWRKKM